MKRLGLPLAILAVTLGSAGWAGEKLDDVDFVVAIEDGDLRTVRQIVEASPKVIKECLDYEPGWWGKPIHWAVINNRKNIAAYLLANGADPNCEDKGGTGPLYLAVKTGNADMVKLLLDSGAEIKKDRPLCVAPNTATAKLLIDRGADLHAKDSWNRTPLHWAAEKDHAEVVALLLKMGAAVNEKDIRDMTPLRLAACRYDRPARRETVALLRKHGALLEQKGSIQDAALGGDLPRVKQIFGKSTESARVRELNGIRALKWAAYGGHVDVVEFLLSQGVEENPPHPRRTPLHMAAAGGHKDVAKLLIDKGAPLIPNGGYEPWPLHMAVYAGDHTMAALLMDKGSDPDKWPKERCTPLHRAAELGRADLVRLFLDRGAEPNAKGRPESPLHCAAGASRTKVLKLLIARGGNVNHKGGTAGRTPLHVAIRRGGSMETVKLLLENGADINALDENGETPLHEVAWHRDLALAAFLVAKGAITEVEDKQGRTPLSVARWRRKRDIVKLLEKHGAKK